MENKDYGNCVRRALLAAEEAERRGFSETENAFRNLASSLRQNSEIDKLLNTPTLQVGSGD